MREGFYSNRTDFIRTAIRNQLASHTDAVKQSIVRHTLELGLRRFSREELEAVKAKGGGSKSRSSGLPPSMTTSRRNSRWRRSKSITVLGALHASKEIKAALADRIG